MCQQLLCNKPPQNLITENNRLLLLTSVWVTCTSLWICALSSQAQLESPHASQTAGGLAIGSLLAAVTRMMGTSCSRTRPGCSHSSWAGFWDSGREYEGNMRPRLETSAGHLPRSVSQGRSQASQDPQAGEIDSSFSWEELQSHIVKDMAIRRSGERGHF